MKSKDLQAAVKNKYENGDGPAKIYRDLGGVVSERTINLRIKIIKSTSSINLSHCPGHPRTIRIEVKTQWRLKQKKRTTHTAKRSSFVPLQENQTTEID